MANKSNDTNGADGRLDHLPALLSSAEEFLQHEYDFLIVGGGTAGLAIAARLTEIPDLTVGVIEAGKPRLDDMLVDTPALFSQMLGNPEYDWMMRTIPQRDRKREAHHIPRGKMLGGSSGINYMMYVRGSDADYNDWADLVDDPSWSAENMKRYMRKHQTLEPFDDNITDRSVMPFVGENHGTNGPIRTSFNDWRPGIEDDVIKACDEVTGFNKKPMDPWSGDHIGFYSTLGVVSRTGPNRGKRSYAARGYFEANAARPNLKVLCEASATSIILNGTTATGVDFTHGGNPYKVKVRKEVILCGGVIHSPQLLELSGIGDPAILEVAGVQCKVELPSVGNNLQDHCITGIAYELTSGYTSFDALHDPEVMADAQKELMGRRGGPLTAISSCQGFFPYKLIANDEDLQKTVSQIEQTTTQTLFQKKQYRQIINHLKDLNSANLQFVDISATINWDEGVENQALLFPPPTDLSKPNQVALGVAVQYPASRGSVHISSSDPAKQPIIDPGYLSHRADLAILAAGMKFLDKVANSAALSGKLGKRVRPRPDVDLQDTRAAEESVTDWILGEYHVCGTCAMGETLDSRLRVRGVKGLRVADASVFPNNVSGNIVSSVYAVAEKAADIIKDDYGYEVLERGKQSS